MDADEDGEVSTEEAEAARAARCADLALIYGSRRGPAPSPCPSRQDWRSRRVSVGLATMRLVCEFVGTLPAVDGPMTVRSKTARTPNDRLARSIAHGDGVMLRSEDALAASITDRLTRYPDDLLHSPIDMRTATLAISPTGGSVLGPWQVPDATPLPGVIVPSSAPVASPAAPVASPAASPHAASVASPGPGATTAPAAPVPTTAPVATALPIGVAVPGGIAEDLSAVLAVKHLSPLALLSTLLIAAGPRRGPCSPGHGKTVMAAYLVGSRGTAATLALGGLVTVSHTAGVRLWHSSSSARRSSCPSGWPALVVVSARCSSVSASGCCALSCDFEQHGARGRRSRSSSHARSRSRPAHAHDPDAHAHEPHAHEHPHRHDGAHESVADGTRPPPSTVSGPATAICRSTAATCWRSLLVLGLPGSVPSVSALVLLLGSLAAGRPAYGLVLVVAFGLGMAIVWWHRLGLVYARGFISGERPATRPVACSITYRPQRRSW